MSAPGEKSFPKLDPAGAAFWDVRYRERFMPWDAGQVPQRLREFVAANAGLRAEAGAAARVLVPGCGTGHDVRFLCESGWAVEGIDFSPAAIEAAQPVLGPCKDRVRLADFFDPAIVPPYALIYERAFLCALPRRLWRDWAERTAALVPRSGRLAGFFYFEPGAERGPPFALHSAAELCALLEPAFARIEDADVPDSVPTFAGKERWQVWERL